MLSRKSQASYNSHPRRMGAFVVNDQLHAHVLSGGFGTELLRPLLGDAAGVLALRCSLNVLAHLSSTSVAFAPLVKSHRNASWSAGSEAHKLLMGSSSTNITGSSSNLDMLGVLSGSLLASQLSSSLEKAGRTAR